MLYSQQADLFLAWIVSGIAFHQDTGMLFFPNELFTSEMKYRFCGQFINKNTSSMWAVFRPTGNYMWKSYMGVGKHLIKRMTTQSASVIYVHSFFNKKSAFRRIFFFFLLKLSKGSLNCSCLTFWVSLFCFWKKKAKPSTLCFQLWSLFICERCSKDTFLHWRKLK